MKKQLLSVAVLAAAFSANAQVKDPAVYQPVAGYSLESLWSKTTFNGEVYPEMKGSNSRGMAVKNGKIYVPKRGVEGEKQIVDLYAYNGMTGASEGSVRLTDAVGTLSFAGNDVQVDNENNFVVGNMSTGLSKVAFEAWVVDELTGKEIKKVLSFVSEDMEGFRIDCFDAWGDVLNGSGIIMAAVSKTADVGGNLVLRWDITDGVAGDVQVIEINGYLPEAADCNSDAPRVCIIDENTFYLDGQNSYATLYDMEGVIIDGIQGEGMEAVTPETPGNNGVDEFSIGEDNFVMYVMSNTATASKQAFNICRLGEGMSMATMELIYKVPEGGMSAESNVVRTALPRIEVKDNVAYLYIFATNGGMAAYKFAPEGATSTESIQGEKVNVVVENGQIIVAGATAVSVYGIDGSTMAQKLGSQVEAPAAKGVYIVKATTASGAEHVAKVMIK